MQKRIDSLNVLRVMMVLVIFTVHGNYLVPGFISRPNGTFTGFVLELFFMVSGFCCALSLLRKGQHIKNSSQLPQQSFAYTVKKLAKVYPLHLVTLLLICALEIFQFVHAGEPLPKKDFASHFVLNFFLLQSYSWNPDIVFSYNGVSWFLSSLVFCYVATPFALYAVDTWIVKEQVVGGATPVPCLPIRALHHQAEQI